MKSFGIMVAVALLAGVLAGCASSGEVKTYTDSSQPINVGSSQEFIIALDSNPTTGYSWQESHDEAMLQMVEKSYQQGESAQKGMIGAGGVEHLRFKALKTGEAKITMVYKRPWEQPSPQDKTQIFTVKIK